MSACTTAIVRVALIAVTTAGQPIPARLSALVAQARIEGRVAAWCGGRLQPGSRETFAAAMIQTGRGGRYIVIDAGAAVHELAHFAGAADLSCYTRADTLRLDRTIRQSETIQGRIVPRWNTTVVCGFVDETTAVCWQFDPAQRAFVRVGGWTT